MQFTIELIQSIEMAAYKGFEVKQVAHLIGAAPSDFEMLFTQENHPAVIAYMKGLYQSQSDLREAVINSAISGSSPAQTEMRKHLDGAMASLQFIMAHE